MLTFLAFPGWNVHWLIWICLVPLLLVARNATPWQGFRIGLLAGFVTNAGGFHWMTSMLEEFGHLPMAASWSILSLQAVTQGLTMAVGTAAWRWLARRGARDSLAAFVGQWLGEATVPMIFPWFFGNAVSPELPMIQIAELGGVSLVSAVVLLVNVAIYHGFKGAVERKAPQWLALVGVGTLVAAVWLYGSWRIQAVDAEMAAAPKLKIGLVEGNVGIWEKEAKYLDPQSRMLTKRHNLLKHQRMSAELERHGAELVLWPESAYMPYGPMPVAHALHHFLFVGAGGGIGEVHSDGAAHMQAPDRLGLPRDLGMLAGLSAGRGDTWRAIDSGRRVLTVSPQGSRSDAVPEGEWAVATLASPPDYYGELAKGWVIGRSGKAWRLAWPAQPLPGKVGAEPAKLEPLSGLPPVGLDLTSAAIDESGQVFAVGRRGAIVGWDEAGLRAAISPTTQDLWAISVDLQARTFVVAGSAGTVLTHAGPGWQAHTVGGSDWYSAWTCPSGAKWVGGQGGQLAVDVGDGRFRMQPSLGSDIVAGACDENSDVVAAGKGGQLWLGRAGGAWSAVAGAPRSDVAAITALVPHPSLALPRTAKRIAPARTPLPLPATAPDDVLADQESPEADRSTPRRGFGVPLLFGALSHGAPLSAGESGRCEDCYNSAVLLDKDGAIHALHDKAFLLAFGEYMPFGETFPWLYDLSPETSRFRQGTRTAPIAYAFDAQRQARFGMLICYEDLLPRHAKKVAAHNPNVLINLTNDAWFGQTAEPEHHLNLALLRSVEYRRWLVRSTNTGISVFIDAVGRRVAETQLTGEETLLRAVPLLESRTPYAVLGDWPLVGLAALLLWLVWGPKRTAPAARASKKRKSSQPAA